MMNMKSLQGFFCLFGDLWFLVSAVIPTFNKQNMEVNKRDE